MLALSCKLVFILIMLSLFDTVLLGLYLLDAFNVGAISVMFILTLTATLLTMKEFNK